MSPDVIAVGVFSIGGAVLGTLVGLFGERLVRTRGEVQCTVVGWRVVQGATTAPLERHLEVRFVNGKEIPVVALEMQVKFYKGGELLEDWARPSLMFVNANRSEKSPPSPINLPPRTAVTQTFSIMAGRHDIQQELAATDRAEFVVSFFGARSKRVELPSPWRD